MRPAFALAEAAGVLVDTLVHPSVAHGAKAFSGRRVSIERPGENPVARPAHRDEGWFNLVKP